MTRAVAESLHFAVIGDRIDHSQSPRMHAAAYAALGLPHSYEKLRTPPDALPGVLARLRSGEFAGLNVTVPLKQLVLHHVDRTDASAAMVGAANTLVREGSGAIVAHNTDVAALADEIRLLGPRPRGPNDLALVIGTGGAARAAVFALASLGFTRIVVRGRTKPAAFVESLTVAFSAPAPASVSALTHPGPARPAVPHAPAFAIPALADEALAPNPTTEADAVVIVQATSDGMQGASSGKDVAEAIAWEAVRDGTIAVDVVYAPPETPFLKAARSRGLASVNGAGMLARQGALAFALWLGLPPPLAPMLAALRAAT